MKLIDPVHFFDAEGVSVLRRRQLERENEELRRRNERLERLLAAMRRQLKATRADDTEDIAD